jgi:hypothetical protein
MIRNSFMMKVISIEGLNTNLFQCNKWKAKFKSILVIVNLKVTTLVCSRLSRKGETILLRFP